MNIQRIVENSIKLECLLLPICANCYNWNNYVFMNRLEEITYILCQNCGLNTLYHKDKILFLIKNQSFGIKFVPNIDYLYMIAFQQVIDYEMS